MNCIIIDDDATARLIVRQLCLKTQKIDVLQEFSSAIDAIKYLNENNTVEIIFLDIHMPSFSGFDFIKTLNNPPNIILTTSDENFALQAFEYDCVVDYLLKPITFERFEKALKKLTSAKREVDKISKSSSIENSDYLYVNVERRLVKIDIKEIFLIEAKGDYINIKTSEKNYIVHSTLKKIEGKLPSSLFLKVHRSFIINISEIIDIEDNSVLIRKNVVPVSRANKSELIKKLNLL